MLHQPAQQFSDKSLRPSRVAQIASEYERWSALYRQVGDTEQKLSPSATKEQRDMLNVADLQAVRRMGECVDDLVLTPAQSLHDLGLKARVLHDDVGPTWYDDENKITQSLVADLMRMNNLSPVRTREFSPSELLPDFVEPEGLHLPLVHVNDTTAPAPTCPVGEMGRRFQHHVDLMNALEHKEGARAAFGKDARIAAQILSAIGDHAPFVQADSAEGALFQVILAADASMKMFDQISESDENQSSAQSSARAINAALTSVRRFLERHFGLDGHQLGGEYCMPDHVGCIPRLEAAAQASSAHAPEKPREFMEAAE